MAIDWENVKAVTIPEGEVKEIKVDGVVKWTKPSPVVADYLCFTAEQAYSTITMLKGGSTANPTVEYSTDATNWTPFVIGDTIVTLENVGDKVYFRGDNERFSINDTNFVRFDMSGEIAASGNVMSLKDKTCESLFANSYEFVKLFMYCSALTSAPKLPATSLGLGCYQQMFNGCTKLVSAPALPATTLAQHCYESMFSGCTKLETATLPAPAPARYCYSNMFMFCSALKSLVVGLTDWKFNGAQAFYSWLTGASATGTFYCPSALDISVRDVSHIPEGWSVVRTD